MYVIRQATNNDYPWLEKLAKSHGLGVTSLPDNEKVLHEKLNHTIQSFSSLISKPQDELYLFLLEDMDSAEIKGISAIVSKMGAREPAYFYRVENIRPNVQILKPISITHGPTEICSLFLMHGLRKEGLGKLLSFCRFLYIANHPGRFEDTITAEMRGIITKDNKSPFWDAIGKTFYPATFYDIMKMRERDEFNIQDVLPEFPIYIQMLPKKAQRVIGKVHENTKPALEMLKDQGFKLTLDVDIYDAGPRIEAETKSIKVIKKSRPSFFSSVKDGEKAAIVATVKGPFRATLCSIDEHLDGSISLSEQAAAALHLNLTDPVRFILLEDKK